MPAQVLIKNSLIIYVILLVALISFSAEKNVASKETDILKITQLLNSRTNGSDAFYSKVLAPAQSLATSKSKSDRITEANEKIISEINLVLTSFKKTVENQKNEAMKLVMSSIDPDLNKNGGASIVFTEGKPSAATSRTFLMIPKKNNSKMTSNLVFNIMTSYKRSAKASDHVYEYPFSENLTQGSVKYVQGSDTTWKGENAALSFDFDKDIVLKKCRQLLGWRCATSLYNATRFLNGDEEAKVLFIYTYDLENNPDHPDFAKDKRSVNQYSGSTAVYVVKESSEWILVYGVDAQWNEGKLSFQGAIQNEFKKDFDRFKERISADTQFVF